MVVTPNGRSGRVSISWSPRHVLLLCPRVRRGLICNRTPSQLSRFTKPTLHPGRCHFNPIPAFCHHSVARCTDRYQAGHYLPLLIITVDVKNQGYTESSTYLQNIAIPREQRCIQRKANSCNKNSVMHTKCHVVNLLGRCKYNIYNMTSKFVMKPSQ